MYRYVCVCIRHMYYFPTLAVSVFFTDQRGEPEVVRWEDVLDPL